MASLAELSLRAQDFRNRKRRQYQQQQGIGPNDYSGYRPNVLDPLGMTTPSFLRGQPGSAAYGTNLNDQQVDARIAMEGGNPAYNQMMRQRQAATRINDTGGGFGGGDNGGLGSMYSPVVLQGNQSFQPTGQEVMGAFLQSGIDAYQSANDATADRYYESLDRTAALGQRNQDRVQNWGIAAEADIDERLKESLGNQRAFLASRGLGNSTIMPDFEARSARDAARERQRVSEMRDSRASEYDTRDTTAYTGILERRQDDVPSYEFLAGMAEKFGAAGDGEGLAAVQAEMAALRNQLGQQGNAGFDPYAGLQAPAQGFSPWAAQQYQASIANAFGQGGGGFPQGGGSGGGDYGGPVPQEALAEWYDAADQDRIANAQAMRAWEDMQRQFRIQQRRGGGYQSGDARRAEGRRARRRLPQFDYMPPELQASVPAGFVGNAFDYQQFPMPAPGPVAFPPVRRPVVHNSSGF